MNNEAKLKLGLAGAMAAHVLLPTASAKALSGSGACYYQSDVCGSTQCALYAGGSHVPYYTGVNAFAEYFCTFSGRSSDNTVHADLQGCSYSRPYFSKISLPYGRE